MEGELGSPPAGAERESPPETMAFARALDRSAPRLGDAHLRAELIAESATVLDAFKRAVDPVGTREALALAGLLGRRSAELGASPVELVAVVEAMIAALAEDGSTLSPEDRHALRGLMFEGHVRASLERAREHALDSRIRSSRPFVLAPRCVALVLQGAPDAEWIVGAVEGLGPTLLGADARAVLVIARFDGEPSDGSIAELATIATVAAVVGARVVWSVPRGVARALAARIGDAADILEDEPAIALAAALATSDGGPVRARVAGLLRRLGV